MDDLDDLIRELEAGGPGLEAEGRETAAARPDAVADTLRQAEHPAPIVERRASRAGSGDSTRLDRWLTLLRDHRASDLLLVAGAPAAIRVDGRVRPIND